MRRSEVPTPALLVDIDILDSNIAVMRGCAAALGVKLRPHAKAHKCVQIAQRIMTAGAIGVSCATIGEAEAMASGGVGGILVTAPLASADATWRLHRLLLRGADIAVVADDPACIGQLSAIAAASGRTLDIVVDVDVGMGRTGCLEIMDVVALARQITVTPALNYAGIQAYWGQPPAGQPLFRARPAAVAVPGRSGARRDRRIDSGWPAARHRYRGRHWQPQHRRHHGLVHGNPTRLLPFHGFLLQHDQHFGK